MGGESLHDKRVVRRFTRFDDEIIVSTVERYGVLTAAKKLSKSMNRTIRSIEERYNKFLRQSRVPFTDEEDQKLLELHKNFGNKWTKISEFFNNKSDIQCRIRIKTLLSKYREEPKPDGMSPASSVQQNIEEIVEPKNFCEVAEFDFGSCQETEFIDFDFDL